MQCGLHRILIVVSSMKKAIGFYTDILRFQIEDDRERSGEVYERITGVAGAQLRVVFLWSAKANLRLELIEYREPKSLSRSLAMFEAGAVRLCFEYEDLEEMEDRLKRRAAKYRGPFLLEKDGRKVAHVLLVQDPQGVEIEFRKSC